MAELVRESVVNPVSVDLVAKPIDVGIIKRKKLTGDRVVSGAAPAAEAGSDPGSQLPEGPVPPVIIKKSHRGEKVRNVLGQFVGEPLGPFDGSERRKGCGEAARIVGIAHSNVVRCITNEDPTAINAQISRHFISPPMYSSQASVREVAATSANWTISHFA
jgi:hypothetical protein